MALTSVLTLRDEKISVEAVVVHVLVTRCFRDRHTVLEEAVSISVPHRGCGELTATMFAGHYFAKLGRQDELISHRQADDRYIVKTNESEALQFWMDATMGDALLSTYDPVAARPFALEITPTLIKFSCVHRTDTIRLELRELLDEPRELPTLAKRRLQIAKIDEAIAAAVVFAQRGPALARNWTQKLASLKPTATPAAWTTNGDGTFLLRPNQNTIQVDFPWRLPQLKRGGFRTRLCVLLPHVLNATLVRNRRELVRTPARPPELAAAPAPAVGVMAADLIRVATQPAPRPLPPIHLDHALSIAGLQGRGASPQELAGLSTLARRIDELAVDWVIAAQGAIAIGWDRIVEDVDLLARACAALDEWAESAAAVGPYR